MQQRRPSAAKNKQVFFFLKSGTSVPNSKLTLTSVGRKGMELERAAERNCINKVLFPRLTDGYRDICGIIL